MCIPGMSMCWDNAGVAINAVLSRNMGSFTETPVSRDKHPRWPAGGARAAQQLQFLQVQGLQRQPPSVRHPHLQSTAFVLRSVIFVSPFSLLNSERITI